VLSLFVVFVGMLFGAQPAAAFCTIDGDGANDPNGDGQKDITQFCQETGTAPFELDVQWNWDEIVHGTGSSDACALFDTNADTLVDNAVCVTIAGSTPFTPTVRVFSCDNSKTKNCSGPVEIVSPASGCTVALSGDDPFPAGDASPQDTKATCTIDAADFGGASLGIVDVCSYTSSSPSSVASDCVLFVPECTIDADCSDSDACNGAEVCTAGACGAGTPLVCDNGAFCDGTEICVPATGCVAGTAVDCSGSGDECNDGVCNEGTDACEASPKTAGASCGDGTSGACDSADTCDGAGSCQDNNAGDGTSCGDAGGECINQDTCTTGVCTDNGFVSSGTGCGSGADTVCDNPDTCDGAGTCQPNVEPGTLECRGTAGTCDVAETCDGAGSCPTDAFVAAATECAGATGVCDVAEACTGGSATCPADGANLTSECRGSAGTCDIAEVCSDASDDCPTDVFVAAATECAGATGVCDVAEACTGGSATCPADGANLTSECRGSAGTCDIAEVCSDASDDCPTDVFVAAATECAGATGVCDVAEVPRTLVGRCEHREALRRRGARTSVRASVRPGAAALVAGGPLL